MEYKYKVVMWWDQGEGESMESQINKTASEGWKLVAAIQGRNLLYLIFERPSEEFETTVEE